MAAKKSASKNPTKPPTKPLRKMTKAELERIQGGETPSQIWPRESNETLE